MNHRALSFGFVIALSASGACAPASQTGTLNVATEPVAPALDVAPPKVAAAVAIPKSPWAGQYPASHADGTKDVLFGTEVLDPYRWLEDAKSPEVQTWMKAQADFAHARLAKLPNREAIATRLKELLYVDAQGTPWTRGSRFFYMRRSGTQEKWVAYYREGKNGKEKVLLDPNTWSSDGTKTLKNWSVSWDGKKVAYAVSENNSDEATMHVMSVDTLAESKVDVIEGAKYAWASWTPRGDGFYYTRIPVDPSIPVDKRPGFAELRFHALGSDPAKDELIREKTGDPTTFVGGGISKDGRWLFSSITHGTKSRDLFFRDLAKHDPSHAKEWTPIAAGKDAHYVVDDYKGQFYVLTDEDAPKSRLFAVDPAHPDRAAWKEIVPERSDATLTGASVVGGKLLLTYLKDVTTRLELHALDGKLVRDIALPAIGSAWFSGDQDRDDLYYSFETFNFPSEIHEVSIKSGKDTVWFKAKVPLDPSAFVVEQAFFPSKDGTRIPMFVVHGKSLLRDSHAPTILNGYGGFRISLTPGFAKSLFPWLERGGVYAVANLRGGGEYGESWHRAGMRHEKQHVFDDFIAAAEYLVHEKYTDSDHLVIEGGSNGGLLVGATVTQRPDLFRAAICKVPLLDMVRYHMFGSGRTWIEEYGTAENEADFRALFAYSPLHHITAGTRYPSVLLDSADSDDRVDPLHARKFAAALQAASSGGPVLLRMEAHAGHGGADQQRAWVERLADTYAFALAEITKPGSVMDAR